MTTQRDSETEGAKRDAQRVPQEVDLEIGETVSGNIHFNMVGGQSITVDRAFAGRVRDRLTHLLAGTPPPTTTARTPSWQERAERAESILKKAGRGLTDHGRDKELACYGFLTIMHPMMSHSRKKAISHGI